MLLYRRFRGRRDASFFVGNFMARPRGITNEIIKLGEQGYKPKEICEALNCATSSVYYVLDKYHIDYNKTQKPLTDEVVNQIIDMRKNNTSYKDIGNVINIDRHRIREICVANGLNASLGNQYTNGKFDRIEHVKQRIKECLINIEYYDNFISCDDMVDLRCTICGGVFTRSMISVRQRKVRCPYCYDKERKNKRIEKERLQAIHQAEALERKKQKAIATKIRHEKQLREAEAKRKKKIHPCIVCGTKTIKPKYCSNACCKRAENKRRETNRRIKIMSQMVDKDITLESLYKRDRGLCHICGLTCNWDDYIIDSNQKQCGEWYPSIDHVIPLSKGGMHSWDNVKLAHRRCNSIKSDKEWA